MDQHFPPEEWHVGHLLAKGPADEMDIGLQKPLLSASRHIFQSA
jgi:hypothetical protein